MVALGTACLGACTFGLDGLSGGVPEAGAPDGAAPTSDGATPTGEDGATATTDAGDASVNCPGHPDAIFCDPFTSLAILPPWMTTANNGGAVVEADASLVASVPTGGTNGTQAEANINAQFPFPTGVFRTYVDIYLDAESNRGAYLDIITLQNGVHTYDIQLFGRDDTTKIETDERLDDGGFTTISTPLPGYPTLPLRTWMRAILEVDYTNATAPAYTFSLENPRDTPAVVLVGPALIDWPFVPNTITVAVGPSDVNEPLTVAWGAEYQNFALTKP